MVWLLVTLFTSLTILASAQKGYGPVDLDAVDPLSLSWNQIHWLVRDQIKEVEELKAEHDEIYNEIAGCDKRREGPHNAAPHSPVFQGATDWRVASQSLIWWISGPAASCGTSGSGGWTSA